jgi:hypothetical protein
LNVVVLPPADDAGLIYAPDGALIGTTQGSQGPNASGVVTPHCIPTSTCSFEAVTPGYGWAVGTFSIETITVSCQNPPSVMQQAINGSWVTLEAYRPNASDDSAPDPGIYDTSQPSGKGHADPPTGAPVASVQAVRGCIYDNTGANCDVPSFITVTNCFTCPYQNCGIGNFLDEDCECAGNAHPIVAGQ